MAAANEEPEFDERFRYVSNKYYTNPGVTKI